MVLKLNLPLVKSDSSRSPSALGPLLVRRRNLRTAACAVESDPASTQLEDPVAARLKTWVLEHSRTLPTQLTPSRLANGAYGLLADEPVQRGQILVRVPRSIIMTPDTARQSPTCGGLVREAGLTEWQSLLLHLLTERALGQRSFWAPYLDALPQDMSSHPLLWGAERLSWLAGSPLVSELAGRQAQVAEDTEALLVAGANDLPVALEHRQATGTDLVTHGSVGWAASILLSRSFCLDLSEEEPMEGDMGYFGTWTAHAPNVLALVPWADLLQHCSSAGPESCAAYQFELAAVTLSSHRNYRVGEAVQDSHGVHLSPADLFLDYGVEDRAYTAQLDAGGPGAPAPGGTAAGAAAEGGGRAEEEAEAGPSGRVQGVGRLAPRHRFDADPSEVAPPRSSRNAALLRALAAVQGEGCRLALGERGPDTASLTFLRAALASDAELVRAGWRVKSSEKDIEAACRAMGSLAEPSSAATEGAVLRALSGYVERALGRFPSSLQQDEDRLAGRAGWPRVEGPERLAVVALASQKRALHGTQGAVATWLSRLDAGTPVAELYDDDEYDMYDGEDEDDGEAQDDDSVEGDDREGEAKSYGRGRH